MRLRKGSQDQFTQRELTRELDCQPRRRCAGANASHTLLLLASGTSALSTALLGGGDAQQTPPPIRPCRVILAKGEQYDAPRASL